MREVKAMEQEDSRANSRKWKITIIALTKNSKNFGRNWKRTIWTIGTASKNKKHIRKFMKKTRGQPQNQENNRERAVKHLKMLRDDCALVFDVLLERKSMLRRNEVEVSEYNKKEEITDMDFSFAAAANIFYL